MTTIDIDAALDAADFATEDVPICLKGSLVAKWEAAEREVAQVQARFELAVKSKSSTAEVAAERLAALEHYQAVEAEMTAASITFTMTGVSEAAWKGVLLKHPPRSDYQLDQFFGYNTAAAPPELIRLTMLSPILSDQQWARLLAALNDAQFQRLLDAATRLNRGSDGTIPFSLAVSEAMSSSEETLTAPSSSESAPSDSGGGPPLTEDSSGTSSPETSSEHAGN